MNRPIDGVDLDGLEFYYAADGSLLWQKGTSTQVMLVNSQFVSENKGKNIDPERLNLNSVKINMSNEELNVRAF